MVTIIIIKHFILPPLLWKGEVQFCRFECGYLFFSCLLTVRLLGVREQIRCSINKGYLRRKRVWRKALENQHVK